MDALNGEVIGRHNGLWYHTVGQRKGIGKVIFPLATARGEFAVFHVSLLNGGGRACVLTI